MSDEPESLKAKVNPSNADIPANSRRLGFMKGEMTIPNDFDTLGNAEIEQLFYVDEKRSQE